MICLRLSDLKKESTSHESQVDFIEPGTDIQLCGAYSSSNDRTNTFSPQSFLKSKKDPEETRKGLQNLLQQVNSRGSKRENEIRDDGKMVYLKLETNGDEDRQSETSSVCCSVEIVKSVQLNPSVEVLHFQKDKKQNKESQRQSRFDYSAS